MSMTFLQLVNDLREKCGISGNALSALSGLTGESLRCKNWINDAYMDVQRLHTDWEWLRTSMSFTTTASQQTYTLANIGVSSTFGKWVHDTFRIYETSAGYATEDFLQEIDYSAWRDEWQFGANRSVTGRPTMFAIAPNKSLCFGPTPDATGYTVLGDYYSTPVQLSADSDEPAFPGRFHQLLVYAAMMSYGAYESAPEVYQRGKEKHGELLQLLEVDQLPAMSAGAALA